MGKEVFKSDTFQQIPKDFLERNKGKQVIVKFAFSATGTARDLIKLALVGYNTNTKVSIKGEDVDEKFCNISIEGDIKEVNGVIGGLETIIESLNRDE